MQENLSESIEDYLKTIYELTAEHGRANTSQIAEIMAVKPGSVTGMIQKLSTATPPLVEYQKHHGVVLTPEGEKAALKTLRSHRLLERFLLEILGFPWDEVHGEAHCLEHVISASFQERMAQVLDNPQYDPHGAPIPGRDLIMPPHATLCMGDLRSGQTAFVQRVPDDDPELLRHLEKIGLVPGAGFSVMDYSPFDENLQIQIAGKDQPVVLGKKITRSVFVDVGTK